MDCKSPFLQTIYELLVSGGFIENLGIVRVRFSRLFMDCWGGGFRLIMDCRICFYQIIYRLLWSVFYIILSLLRPGFSGLYMDC